jgi:hypothetical protein
VRKFERFGAAVLTCLLISSISFSQSPESRTSPNEGVCDVLEDATPGLYGLCIAYCETQDCQPDFSLDDPFQDCKPSDEKILENYRRKMRAGDPDMPCVLQTPCPCWTADEMAEFPPNSEGNCNKCTISYELHWNHYQRLDIVENWYCPPSTSSRLGRFMLVNWETEGYPLQEVMSCKYRVGWTTQPAIVYRNVSPLSEDEYWACVHQLRETGAYGSYPCFFP